MVTLARTVLADEYSWKARCLAQPELWRSNDPYWLLNQISDCVGTDGAQEYVLVAKTGPLEQQSSTTVTWHAPNWDSLQGLGVNSQGDPNLLFVDLCFKQEWRDASGAKRPTGSCFTAFAQEKVFIQDLAGNIQGDTGWIPATPSNTPAFQFDSPCIMDRKGSCPKCAQR